ncbi:hypothetical protein CYMTET_42233 [Cymbomonas tetramitiformis]|uniref:Uncharacterized protein n=1 Tax=Cymbomonas tetramitiformis TaxID=36881 RepID=A0AAE0C5T6_9CHLO|nr:hypothetical protein CYMTET_42233 [Cymbomonas tetramitiformis]
MGLAGYRKKGHLGRDKSPPVGFDKDTKKTRSRIARIACTAHGAPAILTSAAGHAAPFDVSAYAFTVIGETDDDEDINHKDALLREVL